MSNEILTLKQITKRFGSKTILDRVDLEIQQGQIFGLVGRNGAGKTTLMRILTGQSAANEGQMSLFNETTERGWRNVRPRTGAIIETPAFYPYLSGHDNLEYYRLQRGLPDRKAVKRMLELVDLADTGKKPFKKYSMGMKQRLGLALSLMHRPDFLILDEPINGLDPAGIIDIRHLLKRLNREQGLTILISSHLLAELGNLATDYAFIEEGRILEQASAAEIHARCRQFLLLGVDRTDLALSQLDQMGYGEVTDVVGAHELRLYAEDIDVAGINQRLVTGGVAVSRLEVNEIQLEDYFMNLIGGQPHA